MNCLCVIPARGGSKRITDKNIRYFLGKPIIGYSIKAARETGLFESVVVSTDSEKIAAIAKGLGAQVPFLRPGDLADDMTGTDDVVRHCLKWFAENGNEPSYVCCLYATAPLVQPKAIKKGLQLLLESGAPSSFSVARFPYPIFRALKITQNGSLEMFWPEHRLDRSQDLPEAFHDAGQFYWADVAKIDDEPLFMRQGALPVELSGCMVQDIDTEEDWVLAEIKSKIMTERGSLL